MSICEKIQFLGPRDPFKSAWNKMISANGNFQDCLDVYRHAQIGNFYDNPNYHRLIQTWSYLFQLSLVESNKYFESVKAICTSLPHEKQVSMLGELFEVNLGGDVEWLEQLFHDVVGWHKSAGIHEEIDKYARRSYLIPLQALRVHYPDVVEARARVS